MQVGTVHFSFLSLSLLISVTQLSRAFALARRNLVVYEGLERLRPRSVYASHKLARATALTMTGKAQNGNE